MSDELPPIPKDSEERFRQVRIVVNDIAINQLLARRLLRTFTPAEAEAMGWIHLDAALDYIDRVADELLMVEWSCSPSFFDNDEERRERDVGGENSRVSEDGGDRGGQGSHGE